MCKSSRDLVPIRLARQVTQLVKYLLNKHEDLSAISSTRAGYDSTRLLFQCREVKTGGTSEAC